MLGSFLPQLGTLQLCPVAGPMVILLKTGHTSGFSGFLLFFFLFFFAVLEFELRASISSHIIKKVMDFGDRVLNYLPGLISILLTSAS
jgi:hypothetical protein